MFTGIIETTGTVTSINPTESNKELIIEPYSNEFLIDVKTGDSIAVNGACMTVEEIINGTFKFTAIHETLSKTNLGYLKIEDEVNLEKAMKTEMRVDGHFVQGHVDTTGNVIKVKDLIKTWEYFIEFPAKFSENVIYVGSIAIDGISLTIAEIVEDKRDVTIIKVAIIPHTYDVTNIKDLQEGSIVNLEFDMLGKYVKRIIQNSKL